MTTDVSPEGLYFPTDITPEQFFKVIGKLRRAARAEIDRLIAFLDSTEPDADTEDDEREPSEDGEPSLGWTAGFNPENQVQDGPGFYMNEDAGRGLEDEHDGAEPDVDLERNLGWANEGGQLGTWYADHSELEAGSPEWPAAHPTWQPPKRRVVAPPLPTIPMSMCKRVSA